jgi:hypothetical protein
MSAKSQVACGRLLLAPNPAVRGGSFPAVVLPVLLPILLLSLLLRAEVSAVADDDFFERKIRPVLVEHCYPCHAANAKKVRGGLLVDSRDALRKGGESGPAVVPGNPDESLLLSAMRHEAFEMPPDKRLPDDVIADFETWIRQGADDPREAATTARSPETGIDIAKGKRFWSFRPRRTAVPPAVQDSDWPDTSIDRYIQARREAAGLAPAADADRQTLIRRVYFALLGLPPTPEQIAAFLHDSRPLPIALAEVVDELLENPHFGERWGRHWLDVVRFAESSGGGRTLLFPEAWRYRDYVIDAFNRDLPFDQFIRQQIAGDLLAASDWRERARQLVATTFLELGPTNYELQDKETLESDIVDEQLDTIGKSFLGMTLGCARCHDHKFDPIPAADYYAMAGILHSTKFIIHDNVSKWNLSELPVAPEQERELQRARQQIAEWTAELAATQKAWAAAGGKPSAQEAVRKSIDPASLPGIVVDNRDAHLSGDWTSSQSVAGFVGTEYLHDNNRRAEEMTAVFRSRLPAAGEYEVRVSYTPGSNRSPRVPVTVVHAAGTEVVDVDQTKPPDCDGSFVSLGVFRFGTEQPARVIVSNRDAAAPGVVIADAVLFLPPAAAELPVGRRRPAEPAEVARLARRIEQLSDRIKRREADAPTRPAAMAVAEGERPGDVHVAIRGVIHNPGPVVPRGALQVASVAPFPAIPEGQSGRLQLANWIADPQNPLTARVIVNRVWYWLFGQGLVRTVDNFGATGDVPSHPELLDDLAEQFIQDGWSVKTLIRHILGSHVYRLSSAPSADYSPVGRSEVSPGPSQADRPFDPPPTEPAAVGRNRPPTDPGNRLLTRMNRQRQDAESIRDAMLMISGSLDLTVGGPNIKPGTTIEYDYDFDSLRRSVYLPVFRNTLPPILGAFDFADPNIQGGKRTTSTIAPQALLLMNHPLVIQQTRAAARQLLRQTAGEEDDTRIDRAYWQVVGRPPSARERQLVQDFLHRGMPAETSDSHPPPSSDDFDRAMRLWSLLYQTLLQSVDFRFVN